jgi:D-alanyl-lipoteichoic acid acyltransferase DltB (MBOAT superfamily)
VLFNSTVFLFGFLPITLAGFFIVARLLGANAAKAWLASSSLFFYGWWNPIYLPLLIGSMAVNYGIGSYLQSARVRHWVAGRTSLWPRDSDSMKVRRQVLIAGLVFNLGLIAYFKYTDFFIDTVNEVAGSHLPLFHIVLPLGISFFTFQKIAYLVDSYQGKQGRPSFLDYALFVGFFPQLIAGPIVHPTEVLPQFERKDIYRFWLARFMAALSVFLLGLAKKVLLADTFGGYADIVFSGAANGAHLTLFEAWAGALAYTLQLYFDFSGYSDMAIGLGRMFGIELPLNFNSPYKSRSISEFWRRWHMTLSRFLRDYVYIPLGGNRKGETRRYVNLMATMLLGGLWHGAAWTFVIWGGLHGAMLVVNHLWNRLRMPKLGIFGGALVMLGVIAGWVLFRAAHFDAAMLVYEGMLGANGAALPAQIVGIVPGLDTVVQAVGRLAYLGDRTVMGAVEVFAMLVLGFALVWFTPNVHQMSERTRLVLAGLLLPLLIQRVLFAGAASPFLYFQF